MDTYTIIATPDVGGVYISQVRATSPMEAFLGWSDKILEEGAFPELDAQQFKKDVDFEMETSGPVAVEGTAQVWCLSLMSMWVHIVKTAPFENH